MPEERKQASKILFSISRLLLPLLTALLPLWINKNEEKSGEAKKVSSKENNGIPQ
jgi:hypothetical protein